MWCSVEVVPPPHCPNVFELQPWWNIGERSINFIFHVVRHSNQRSYAKSRLRVEVASKSLENSWSPCSFLKPSNQPIAGQEITIFQTYVVYTVRKCHYNYVTQSGLKWIFFWGFKFASNIIIKKIVTLPNEYNSFSLRMVRKPRNYVNGWLLY